MHVRIVHLLAATVALEMAVLLAASVAARAIAAVAAFAAVMVQ